MATNEAILPQNKHLTIVPAGIKRHQHDLNCQDNGCEEIINMRYRHGAWETVGDKTTVWAYDHGCHDLYYHAEINEGGGAVYIGYRLQDHKVYTIDTAAKTKTELKQLSSSPAETFLHFSSLNNILIITTSLNVYNFFWNSDQGAYLELSRAIRPDLYFYYKDVESLIVGDETDYLTQAELFDAIQIGIYKKRQKGLFCNTVAVMQWAFRMWDGSYIMHSNPVIVPLALNDEYFTQVIDPGTPTNEVFRATLNCGRPAFKINADSGVFDSLEKYKGLITHLCIFMSQDVSKYLYEYNDTPYDTIDALKYFKFGDNEESLDQLMKMHPYYLAKELTLDEVLDSVSTDEFEINLNEATNKINFNGDVGENIDTVEKIPVRHNVYSWKKVGQWIGHLFNPSNNPKVWYTTEDVEQTTEVDDTAGTFALQKQPELPVDDFSHHIIIPETSAYIYNARLHIGDIKLKFGGALDQSVWYNSIYTATKTIAVDFYQEITIETDQGTKYVWEQFTPWVLNLAPNSYSLTFPNVISYPDARAVRMRIIAQPDGHTNYYELADYKLQSHKIYNFAYAVTNKTVPAESSGGLSYISYADLIIIMTGSTFLTFPICGSTADAIATDNRYYTDHNRVQISSINNPLYFPSINSYQFGNSRTQILAFGSQSTPMSAGQFGQFPLHVFTSEGIYLMQQGQGQVVYAAVIPFNKEIAFKHSICELGGVLVFATADGVKMLAGSQLKHISREVEGTPSDKLIYDNYYINFIDDPTNHLVHLYHYLSIENFLDYLGEDVRICYDNMKRELIVTNCDLFSEPEYGAQLPYSYVYNLEAGNWHKVTDAWHQFVIVDGLWYALKNFRYGHWVTGMGAVRVNDETPAVKDCLIQTRPMKWGTYDFKKMKKIVQRSLCNVNDPLESTPDDDDKFGLYLFASMENSAWKFVKGIKVSQAAGLIQAPELPGLHASVRQLALLTCVNSKDFVMSHWEILCEHTSPGTMGQQARLNTENLLGDYDPDEYGQSYDIGNATESLP